MDGGGSGGGGGETTQSDPRVPWTRSSWERCSQTTRRPRWWSRSCGPARGRWSSASSSRKRSPTGMPGGGPGARACGVRPREVTFGSGRSIVWGQTRVRILDLPLPRCAAQSRELPPSEPRVLSLSGGSQGYERQNGEGKGRAREQSWRPALSTLNLSIFLWK